MARNTDDLTNITKIIGKKIYDCRSSMKLSREDLAQKVHITNQQLQKYEKGVNRVSAGRLAMISKALDVPISFFYSDLDVKFEDLGFDQKMVSEISKNFMRIKNVEHKKVVNTLIKSLIKNREE